MSRIRLTPPSARIGKQIDVNKIDKVLNHLSGKITCLSSCRLSESFFLNFRFFKKTCRENCVRLKS